MFGELAKGRDLLEPRDLYTAAGSKLFRRLAAGEEVEPDRSVITIYGHITSMHLP